MTQEDEIKARRGPGRPPAGDESLAEAVNLRLTPSMLADIEEVRRERGAGVSSSQVMRDLLVDALKRWKERA